MEAKLALLTTEIERLTVQLRNKNDEIEKYKMQINALSSQLADSSKNLESKNAVYGNEIERLNNILK